MVSCICYKSNVYKMAGDSCLQLRWTALNGNQLLSNIMKEPQKSRRNLGIYKSLLLPVRYHLIRVSVYFSVKWQQIPQSVCNVSACCRTDFCHSFIRRLFTHTAYWGQAICPTDPLQVYFCSNLYLNGLILQCLPNRIWGGIRFHIYIENNYSLVHHE